MNTLRMIGTIFIGASFIPRSPGLPTARQAPLQNNELKIASVAMNLAKQFVSPFILLSRLAKACDMRAQQRVPCQQHGRTSHKQRSSSQPWAQPGDAWPSITRRSCHCRTDTQHILCSRARCKTSSTSQLIFLDVSAARAWCRSACRCDDVITDDTTLISVRNRMLSDRDRRHSLSHFPKTQRCSSSARLSLGAFIDMS
jgi:hypothetical protein